MRAKNFMQLLIYLFLVCLSTEVLYSEPLKVKVNAESAILMNAKTGAILYEKHSRKMMYPASITKIATILLALKLSGSNLDEMIQINQEMLATSTEEAKIRSNYTSPPYELVPDGTKMGIKKDERVSLRELLYGMMLVSGNDAANAVAFHLGKGSINHYMEKVNAYLKQIGCKNTHFLNPHGLFHPKHQTTAYDMALMTSEALKDPTFCKIVSTVQYSQPKTNKSEGRVFVQYNKLLRRGPFYYPKAIGVKTGYLSKAGHTLVAAAESEGRMLVAVLLKAKERSDKFKDAIKLFEAAFDEKEVQRTLLKGGPQSFELQLEGASQPIKTRIEEDAVISYFPAEEQKIKALLYWEDLTLPVKKNQRVGHVKIKAKNGHVLLTVPLLAQDDVKATWLHWLKHLF
jgi:D-alanyl-D-alanine carboxypeptidase (penicillin-binding protein 5/6)